MLLSKTVRLFLDSIGKREEYEYYLNRFLNHEAPFFALLCPDRESMELSGDLLVFDLQFLVQLGLKAAVLLYGDHTEAAQATFAGYDNTFSYSELPVEERIAVLSRPGKSLEEALRDLIPATARRIHFVRFTGSLHDEGGAPVTVHYTHRDNKHILRESDRELVALSASILERHPSVHISVCTPLGLLEEMFTVKGQGTIIRRGSQILCLTDGHDVDFPRIRALCEEGFGKALSPSVSFDPINQYFIESNYRGAALLEKHTPGYYLSKFVVSRQARGEGLAQELWEVACQDKPALYWRSRSSNPINSWYDKQADGFQRGPQWNVFWRGIAPEHISGIIEYCRSRPPDFEEVAK
jgi:hypothetical protein